jgi:hypothetical protein
MDSFVRKIFRQEVELQCRAALSASNDLAAADTKTKVWIALQSLLVASANISKFLWGSQGKAAGERADLRSSLGVGDTSPLRDPDLRNDFEHCDSRLVGHFKDNSNSVRIYSGRNVSRSRATPVSPQGERREFQHFDPVTGIVTFWEHSSSVPDLVAEAVRILSAVYPEESFQHAMYRPPSLGEVSDNHSVHLGPLVTAQVALDVEGIDGDRAVEITDDESS